MSKKKFTLKAWDRYLLISVIVIAFIHVLLGDIDNLTFTFQTFKSDNSDKHSIGIIFPRSYAAAQEASDNCIAAKNLDWNCYIFGYALDTKSNRLLYNYVSAINWLINYFYQPDFLIYLVPELVLQGKQPTRYAILDIMNADILKYREKGAIEDINLMKWMTSYDGFILYGNEDQWFKDLTKLINKKYKINTHYIYDTYPSVYSTAFAETKKKKLVYYGNNWDAKRSSEHYKEIYRLLDKQDYFEVYGDAEVWNFLKNSYHGKLPFNGKEFNNRLEELGIALVLHSNFHLKYGIPSKRIFEASAASNVIISDQHSFVEREFRDCVYYINPEDDPKKVALKIDQIVKKVQSNQELANNKAKCAHDIFVNKFAIENQLLRIGKMHEMIKNAKGP